MAIEFIAARRSLFRCRVVFAEQLDRRTKKRRQRVREARPTLKERP
ncbi:hypothetical protein Mnod_3894 [Methylobacterium nodulans ORS 2060]|uniref:Uncharacterized protein n=1 Tax=Methylobacterium nodulans (strain LMG 21967 / CNCM I-2342 / ORS 2060) TaxID=460265 RepID=B8ISF4_METNO|nr:hypothetical protein Mnod_3894 [Methylobacterium nodulans ORS 2060]